MLVLFVYYAERTVPNNRTQSKNFAYLCHGGGLALISYLYNLYLNGFGLPPEPPVEEPATEEEELAEWCEFNQDDPICKPEIDGIPRPVRRRYELASL